MFGTKESIGKLRVDRPLSLPGSTAQREDYTLEPDQVSSSLFEVW